MKSFNPVSSNKLYIQIYEQVRDAIKAEINEINRALPSFKQVREVELRSEEFEKTTSKKIKRFLLK